MTKEEFRGKMCDLIKTNDEMIEKSIATLEDRFADEIAAADNDFALPKAFLSAIMQDMANQWMPLCTDNIFSRRVRECRKAL